MDLPLGISVLQRTDRWIRRAHCAVLTIIRDVFEGTRVPSGPPSVRFSSSSLRSKIRPFSLILRLAARLKWWGENVYFLGFGDNRFILDAYTIRLRRRMPPRG
jgi:hypothetical protein